MTAKTRRMLGHSTMDHQIMGISGNRRDGVARPTGFEDEGDLSKQAKICGVIEELVE